MRLNVAISISFLGIEVGLAGYSFGRSGTPYVRIEIQKIGSNERPNCVYSRQASSLLEPGKSSLVLATHCLITYFLHPIEKLSDRRIEILPMNDLHPGKIKC